MYNLIIPIVVYLVIFFFFGFTVFKWAVLFGIIIGILALIYLLLEKDPEFNKKQEKFLRWLKKMWDFIWN